MAITLEGNDETAWHRYRAIGSPDSIIEKHERLGEDLKKQKERVKDLEPKLPPEGAVVLTGDDAKVYEGYKALGLKPEEVKTKIEEGEKSTTELALIGKRTKAREFGELAGFKNPDAFVALRGATDLEFEKRTDTVEDKAVERAYAKGADGQFKLLDAAFIAANPEWKPLAAALDIAPAAGTSTGGAGSGAGRMETTVPSPPLGGGGEKKGEDDYRKAAEATADYNVF